MLAGEGRTNILFVPRGWWCTRSPRLLGEGEQNVLVPRKRSRAFSPRLCEPPSSLHQCEQRLAFFDDIGGELARGDAADVLRRMDRSGRNEEYVPGLERHRRLALDVILERAVEDIDDLFARMGVPAEGYARVDVDAHLDGLASGHAEIVPLQVGSLDSRLLRPRHRQRKDACGDQRRYRNGPRHLHGHVELLMLETSPTRAHRAETRREPPLMTAAPCRPAPGRCSPRTSPTSSRRDDRSASRARRARLQHAEAPPQARPAS